MSKYTAITHIVNVGVGASGIFVVGGDPRRVSLVMVSISVVRFGVSFTQSGSGGSTWIVPSSNSQIVFPYRDYGPLVQYPVYLSYISGGAGDVSITEIIKLPGCNK